MWPFPTDAIHKFSKNLSHIIVPELNLGQVAHEVEHAVGHDVKVLRVNKITGEPIHPEEILIKIEECL
jgi:2-oxoglutarate ferredoxin oxidoreductase subunit alpha